MFLFLILINAAGFKENLRNIGETITNPALSKRKPIEKIHMKWIDDMTIAVYTLKKKLLKTQVLTNLSDFMSKLGISYPRNAQRCKVSSVTYTSTQ